MQPVLKTIIGMMRYTSASAIAYDASSDGGIANPVSSLTWSHTCTGSNRILFVGCFGESTDVITGATYNAVAMTLVGKILTPNDRYVYLFYLIAPATGANNIVISRSGSGYISGMATSYTGAKQTGQPDASTTSGTGPSTSKTTTLTTTIVTNCWTVLISHPNAGVTQTASAGLVFRQNNTSGLAIGDSNAPLAIGSTSLTSSIGTSQYWGTVMASFAPA